MICDTFYEQVEYHDKMQAILYPEDVDTDVNSYEYLSIKVNEFCSKTGVKPYEIFKRSRKEYYVAIKVAFVRYVGEYSPFRIAKYMGYDHSSVYNWIDLHDVYIKFDHYKSLISKF